MATTYILACSANGEDATLEIVDNLDIFTFQDTWKCREGEEVFGAPAEGNVSRLGKSAADDTPLSNGSSTPHLLHGFHTNIGKGDSGTGEKNNVGGSFPSGAFAWVCTKVS